jgi:hypothetical protein
MAKIGTSITVSVKITVPPSVQYLSGAIISYSKALSMPYLWDTRIMVCTLKENMRQ